MALALQHTNGGTVVESDIDVKRSGRIIYEFEIINAGVKYEIEIDGDTGTILDFERNGKHIYIPVQPAAAPAAGVAASPAESAPRAQSGGTKIAAETAQSMAREKIGGGMVSEYKLETSGGRYFHEIVIVLGNKRHRLEIDDESGAIRELSVRDAD